MKYFLTIIALFIFINGFSQLGIKVSQYRPANILGRVFDKSVAGEISYVYGDSEDRLLFHFAFSHTKLSSREDTIRTYAISNKDDRFMVYPGYVTYSRFNISFLSMGVDYAFIKTRKFITYAGMDVIFGNSNIKYESYYATISNESFNGKEFNIGIRPRFGATFYITKKLGIFTELTRNIYKDIHKTLFANNEFGLGIRYKLFNKR